MLEMPKSPEVSERASLVAERATLTAPQGLRRSMLALKQLLYGFLYTQTETIITSSFIVRKFASITCLRRKQSTGGRL